MEYLDICDEKGKPTGKTVSREDAHRDGIPHRTAHVWIIRNGPEGYEILLQKRSMDKDSYPGFYDTSSAGHIPAGDEPSESAVRELGEELGIRAETEDLIPIGTFHKQYEKIFHGKPFRDNEFVFVYVYGGEVDTKDLTLQKSEVDEVRWFGFEDVCSETKTDRSRICVPSESLGILGSYLKRSHP